MLRFAPEKTKILFFDLEYFVPEEDRDRQTPSGMVFSPVLPGHKILGGVFVTYYPMQDRVGERKSVWEWRLGSEKAVLEAIFEILEGEWKSIEAKAQAGSLMLGGIGISHSDVPALLFRLTSNGIASSDRVFGLISGCRQVDLSVATYCQFAFNREYFSYPKSKSNLYQKYLNGKRLQSGKSVWESYENEEFESIERRCRTEVDDSLEIYKSMIDIGKSNANSLKRLKKLEKSAKGGDAKI